MKNATGLGEEETVKVVRNGVGGKERVWKPRDEVRKVLKRFAL